MKYAVQDTVGRLWDDVRDLDWLGFYPVVRRETGVIVAVVEADDVRADHGEFDEDEGMYWER
jgi:hypothetical protein